MVFNIPSNATAVDDEGREVVFADGEENVPIVSLNAEHGFIEFRLYGTTFFIHLSALRQFVAGGVNG